MEKENKENNKLEENNNKDEFLISPEEGFDKQEEKIDANIQEGIIDISDEKQYERADAKYDASSLQVLEGLEAVRKRPGMYIATTSSTGLHHLIWEIVDNSIDEALAGYCDTISIDINKGESITVTDNGRGVPVDIVSKTKISGVETAFTKLHAGGKFGEGGGYKVSGGLHGVGASVVNALSSSLDVTVHKDGGIYFMHFENGGKAVDRLKKIGECNDHGTSVTFQPDPKIFKETIVFNYETIKNRIRQMAFLNKNITMILTDKREDPEVRDTFHFDGGIQEYIQYIDKNATKINDDVIYIEGAQKYNYEKDNEYLIMVEVAMQYTAAYTHTILSFCNNVTTGNGGTHEDGFNLALTRVFNAYAREYKFLKDNDKEKFNLEDCVEGLTAIISIKHPNPQYEGQTKGKLGNLEVKKITSNIVGAQLEKYLLEHKEEASNILKRIRSAYEARLAANASRNAKRKNGLEITTLPGKLADCISNDPKECELFIVEGNSAGGSAKQGRDNRTQAILPLRGKILNVQKAQTHRIFDNAEIGNMISAIGAGYGTEFDISKVRYHKVVIMTDADVDGSHIQILLLTFFNRFMKPLIDHGYVYIAQPPLYKVEYKNKDYYAYTDEQLEIIRKTLNLKSGYPYQRYKGLGEMDPSQLEETTMDPKIRKMLRVTVEDAAAADAVFEDLMGEDVEPRSQYIKKNAKFVKNLDI